MKAITLYQPWALLLACKAKKFETRSWATNYRGEIAIHAGKKEPHNAMISLSQREAKAIYDCIYAKLGIKSGALMEMPLGSVIATAEIAKCHQIVEIISQKGGFRVVCVDGTKDIVTYSIYISDEEYVFGDWTPGRYAWELKNVKMLDKPIPVKGKQGLWNWEPPEGISIRKECIIEGDANEMNSH